MGGGLMQLVAYGAQDVYLTGNPQITFWKVTYRRHTNFAMESIEQTFNGQADFGRRVTCTISRNGDLAYRTYLQVTLPEIDQSLRNATGEDVFARWLDFPGEQLILRLRLRLVASASTASMATGCTSGTSSPLSRSRSVATTRWLATPPSLPTSPTPASLRSTVRATPLPQARSAPRATPSRRPLSTCRSSSGTAATRALRFRSSPSSTTRSRSTSTSVPLTSASGLSQP